MVLKGDIFKVVMTTKQQINSYEHAIKLDCGTILST